MSRTYCKCKHARVGNGIKLGICNAHVLVGSCDTV